MTVEKVVRRCRQCHGAVQPPRRTFCSDWCVDLFLVCRGGRFAREWVWLRDGGTCALCGVDTTWRERCNPTLMWRWLLLRGWVTDEYPYNRNVYQLAERWNDALRGAWGQWCGGAVHAWEADHIVPKAEGGDGCDLSGLRTLCRPCHVVETGLLRRRLNERRRLSREQIAC